VLRLLDLDELSVVLFEVLDVLVFDEGVEGLRSGWSRSIFS
jgi:hypothetical protein